MLSSLFTQILAHCFFPTQPLVFIGTSIKINAKNLQQETLNQSASAKYVKLQRCMSQNKTWCPT